MWNNVGYPDQGQQERFNAFTGTPFYRPSADFVGFSADDDIPDGSNIYDDHDGGGGDAEYNDESFLQNQLSNMVRYSLQCHCYPGKFL